MTDPTGTSMIRSEEQLHITTRSIPAGRAVLRKTIVVEQRTITVEVRHEEAHLEILPLDSDANDGSDQPQAPHQDMPDLLLRREEIVISTRLVPTERIRLEVHTITDQQHLTEAVRHEEIEISGNTTPA